MRKKSSEFINPMENLASFQLRRTALLVWAKFAESLEQLGLRPSDANLLMIIGANQGCSQSDLCRALRAKPTNMVPMVNSLMAMGVVEKGDAIGRSVPLYLTEDGERLLKKVKVAVIKHEKKIFSALSKTKCDQLTGTLQAIFTSVCTHPHPHIE